MCIRDRHYPNAIYLIMDQTQYDLTVSEGALSDDYQDTVLSAATIEELAEKIGNIVAGAAMLMTGAVLIEPGALGKMAGAIAVVAGADPQTAGYIAMAVGLAATITVGVVMAVASFGAGAVSAGANACLLYTSMCIRDRLAGSVPCRAPAPRPAAAFPATPALRTAGCCRCPPPARR